MKISIVTVVYCAEDTIGIALESVAQQTWKSIEHVVIDGASTDGTLEEIRLRKNEAMVVVSEPDNGIYDALNKGFSLTTGDVVGIVHADDILADDRVLESIAQSFADPRVDAVYGDLDYVARDDPGRVIRHWRAGAFSTTRLRFGWMPPHPTLFLRKRVLEKLGLFDTSFRVASDYDLVLRYFGAGAIRPVYVPRVLVKMRVGGASNRSLGSIIEKSREDYRALRKNGVGGLPTLAFKNLTKIPQFFQRN